MVAKKDPCGKYKTMIEKLDLLENYLFTNHYIFWLLPFLPAIAIEVTRFYLKKSCKKTNAA